MEGDIFADLFSEVVSVDPVSDMDMLVDGTLHPHLRSGPFAQHYTGTFNVCFSKRVIELHDNEGQLLAKSGLRLSLT